MNQASQSSEDESSMLYSLNELLDLEEKGIKEETDRRWRAELRLERKKEEERAQRKAAEEACLQKEADERHQVDLRRREEEVRLSAIREAELRKATLLAEEEGRLLAIEQSNEHQRRLFEIRADRGKRRLRWLLLASFTATVALGVWFSRSLAETQKSANARRLAHELASHEFAVRSLAMKSRFEKRLEELREEKRQIQYRGSQKRQNDALTESEWSGKSPPAKGPGSPVRRPAVVPPPPPKKTCEPGDPLCSDISPL